jgi:hypothetical protein
MANTVMCKCQEGAETGGEGIGGRSKEMGGAQRVECCFDKNFNPVCLWVDLEMCQREAQGQRRDVRLPQDGTPKRV